MMKKATNIREIVRRMVVKAVAVLLGRHFYTVEHFFNDPSSWEDAVEFWDSEGVNDSRTSIF